MRIYLVLTLLTALVFASVVFAQWGLIKSSGFIVLYEEDGVKFGVLFTRDVWVRSSELLFAVGSIDAYPGFKFIYIPNATTDPELKELHDTYIAVRNCNASITTLWENQTFSAVLECLTGKVWEFIINNPYGVNPRVVLDGVELRQVPLDEYARCLKCFTYDGMFIRVKALGSTHILTIYFSSREAITETTVAYAHLKLGNYTVRVGDRVVFTIVLVFSNALPRSKIASYSITCVGPETYVASGNVVLEANKAIHTISDSIIFSKAGTYTCKALIKIPNVGEVRTNEVTLQVIPREVGAKPEVGEKVREFITFNIYLVIILLIVIAVVAIAIYVVKRRGVASLPPITIARVFKRV